MDKKKKQKHLGKYRLEESERSVTKKRRRDRHNERERQRERRLK